MKVSKSLIARIWKEADLKPHRLERYLASHDPQFDQKAAVIIGLYLKSSKTSKASIRYKIGTKDAVPSGTRFRRDDEGSSRFALGCPGGDELICQPFEDRILLPRPGQKHAAVHEARTGNIRSHCDPRWAPFGIFLNNGVTLELTRKVPRIFRTVQGKKGHAKFSFLHNCREALHFRCFPSPCFYFRNAIQNFSLALPE